MEEGFRRAMMDQHNNLLGFLTQLVVNPLTLVLLLGNVFTVLGQTQFWGRFTTRFRKSARPVQYEP
jgi:hypothetical protein